MWRALSVSLAILILVVPVTMWIMTCVYGGGNYKPHAINAYSEPKEKPDTVKNGVYTYHRKGTVVTLQSVNKEEFDANNITLTYQPPGAEKSYEMCMRLADIELLIRAVRDFRFDEPGRMRREKLRRDYESGKYRYHSTYSTYP